MVHGILGRGTLVRCTPLVLAPAVVQDRTYSQSTTSRGVIAVRDIAARLLRQRHVAIGPIIYENVTSSTQGEYVLQRHRGITCQ